MITKNSLHVKAFSLPELLVVLVIMGILVLLAIPNLMPLISRAKSSEAKIQLAHVHMLQRTYFFEYSKYSDDLTEIGYEQEKLITENGTANYRIEVLKANEDGFIAKATSVVDFDKDGQFNVWEIDQDKTLTETIKD